MSRAWVCSSTMTYVHILNYLIILLKITSYYLLLEKNGVLHQALKGHH